MAEAVPVDVSQGDGPASRHVAAEEGKCSCAECIYFDSDLVNTGANSANTQIEPQSMQESRQQISEMARIDN